MTIKYKVVQVAQAGVKGGGSHKYYPRIHKRNKVSIRRLAENIADKSSLNVMDVVATLYGLVDEIPDLLLDNCSIDMGDLGIFSANIRCEASDHPENVSKQNIKEVKIAFRPGKIIKNKLKNAEFILWTE